MNLEEWASPVLIGVGVLASALNAVAGGGTLLAFPVLMGFGASALHANATCSAALWLGGLASALGYSEQQKRMRGHLKVLLLPSAVGSLVGDLSRAGKNFRDLETCLNHIIVTHKIPADREKLKNVFNSKAVMLSYNSLGGAGP